MRALCCAALLLLCAVPVSAEEKKPMTTDEGEVTRLAKEFITAWNKGDPRALAAFYAEDGVRVGAFGEIARGRTEVEAAYTKLLTGPRKGATATYEPTVRVLA